MVVMGVVVAAAVRAVAAAVVVGSRSGFELRKISCRLIPIMLRLLRLCMLYVGSFQM